MRRAVAALAFIAVAQPLCAAELSLDQQLIIACYELRVDVVVRCLRDGANVNARFGRFPDKLDPFYDRRTGSSSLGTHSWTPLLALASAEEYPQPPAELGEIWKDSDRAHSVREQIPRERIERRRRGSMVILRLLLSHGCRLDDHDGYGATALYMAAEREHLPMVRTLLEFGANPNTKTETYIDGPSDVTPLHVACRSQEIVRLLLEHGADASAKDSDGNTPAEWVALDPDRTFELVETVDGWRLHPKNSLHEQR